MKEKKEISQAKQPNAGWEKTKAVFRKIGRVLQIIGKVLFHLRKIFLAVPVVWAAFKVYAYGQANLPEAVGVWLLENGDYQFTLARESALMSCMAVTAACLVLMFCSRRTLTPWLVSVFSLALPVIILITNTFPA